MFRCLSCDRVWDISGRELEEIELAMLALAGELDDGYLYVACEACSDPFAESRGSMRVTVWGLEETDG